MIDNLYLTVSLHLVGALLVGGLIGLERSFHGRPAGFRTHALVCLASSLLMLVTLFQWHWFPSLDGEVVQMDPTRMAQGIMTGIGFLGAGVIIKEGLSVRGLTTAASLWVTAAIGILIGIGFYFPAALATLLTLGALSLFRRIEAWMPSQSYARFYVAFQRNDIMPEDELMALLKEHGFTTANLSQRISDAGKTFEYRMVIRSADPSNGSRLSLALCAHDKVKTFRISPTGD